MKKFIAAVAAAFISACSSTPEYQTVEVTADQFGDKWPLTVDKGTLHCEPPTRIVFTAPDGQKYGVNGSAANDYVTILEITKDHKIDIGTTFKMDPSILIEEGMKLCQK
ncbi:YebY family protein [Acinetobacter baumannii]|uniref:DUF2511 domain-containing protein n=1 Tax=Acinetobacter TaxID=469 RepID=UPI0002D0DC72|nr:MULTISPECIES: DUF2511 domain-containing protein [Acinetobacter]ENX28724.1 hypothetical protein F890_02702 [Acinetobacter sp. CIP 64.7]MCL6173705.1 YebY family protein [Acinetobacter baumannii]MCL6197580.1 YebY family protein [Acinetobacter baumannii]